MVAAAAIQRRDPAVTAVSQPAAQPARAFLYDAVASRRSTGEVEPSDAFKPVGSVGPEEQMGVMRIITQVALFVLWAIVIGSGILLSQVRIETSGSAVPIPSLVGVETLPAASMLVVTVVVVGAMVTVGRYFD